MDAPSFDDKGFGPPPAKWKGTCQLGGNISGCNNKVIGARAYNLDPLTGDLNSTPADEMGHGWHTASTVAGNPVQGANLYGLGEGTARGGVPSASIAVYKVCRPGCSDMSILAAFDDAVNDGVDLLSLSISGYSPGRLHDSIAIRAFHAMKKGILTSCAAGNEGPYLHTLNNGAPWIFTVGASATDRVFKTPVRIGKHTKTLVTIFLFLHSKGGSMNTFHLKRKTYPFTSGAKASMPGEKDFNCKNQELDHDRLNKELCEIETLDEKKVKGKIVYCNGGNKNYIIKNMGGIVVIMGCEPAARDAGYSFIIPAA
ncbi:subtilisin-like protease SBT4.15 [Durio zibethinus]|uniref:Subtilisin-like protease SBT4.15 n=1 Tax=Durio zibethinus TaxID=66656 RepID=A0A6P5ZNY5_DURZI|nr:subtilisin-like protease SBT4.15 [Durio zibethinus]